MKILKTNEDYQGALAETRNLIALDPEVGTPDADRLELLALLVEEYEAHQVDIPLPDPIEAIEFRMEQEGLTPRDLIPYIGSRSKVSEVLSRKRPLTLPMIRALQGGLGIPAHVLIQGHDPGALEESEIDWSRFPLREMMTRKWISATAAEAKSRAEEILRTYFQPIGSPQAIAILPRQSTHIREAKALDRYALLAWAARVMHRALEEKIDKRYKPGTVTSEFAQEVARLSSHDNGPLLAQDFLRQHGIALVVERHLPHTQLDGAALFLLVERPVIGMTLRYDRLDSFWFTLMHELAHVALHSKGDVKRFFDDLEADSQGDIQEQEANDFAGEALIPNAAWNNSAIRILKTPETIQLLADELRIHPAIVAGRLRHLDKNYRLYTKLVGNGEVRKHFPAVDWGR